MHNLSVIIPFYNENKYLLDSINRVLEIGIANQIILSDDFSNDGSEKIAEKLSEEYEFISYIRSNENKGKGNALNNAKDYIKTSHVVIHDADLEYFPEDIVEMYNEAIKLPESLIIGSRVKGDKERTKIYYSTYIGNKIFSYIFSIVNQTKLSDIASCYWLINLTTFRGLNLNEKGFAIEVEVLSKFLLTGSTIKEVPIKYEARSYENGKKIKLKDAISIFHKILKYSKLFNS